MSDHLTGHDQAENMLRRVSPEGRALALREQRRKQRQQMRMAGRVLLVALLVVLALVAVNFVLGALTPPVIAAAMAVFIAASIATLWVGRERPVAAGTLNAAPLQALPSATAAWLERQCPALPPPAANLSVNLAARLHEMEPQLARLDDREPAAQAVRRLLAVELPELVERHQSVPPRLRGEGGDSGQSPDAYLLNGLQIIDEEVSRMTMQLARGDLDGLATQDRFLELKYQGDEMLRLPSP